MANEDIFGHTLVSMLTGGAAGFIGFGTAQLFKHISWNGYHIVPSRTSTEFPSDEPFPGKTMITRHKSAFQKWNRPFIDIADSDLGWNSTAPLEDASPVTDGPLRRLLLAGGEGAVMFAVYNLALEAVSGPLRRCPVDRTIFLNTGCGGLHRHIVLFRTRSADLNSSSRAFWVLLGDREAVFRCVRCSPGVCFSPLSIRTRHHARRIVVHASSTHAGCLWQH